MYLFYNIFYNLTRSIMTKKNLFYLFLFLELATFLSCSTDDDNEGSASKTVKLYVSKITLDGFEDGRPSYYTFSYDESNRVAGWNARIEVGSNTFDVSRKINYTSDKQSNILAGGIESIEEYVNEKLMFTEIYSQEPSNNMTYKDAAGAHTSITDVSSLWQYLTVTSDYSHIDRNYKYDSFYKDPNPKSLKVSNVDNRRNPRWIQYEYIYTYDETKKGIFTDCNLPVWVINMRFYNYGEDFPINQNVSKVCTGVQYKRLESKGSNGDLEEKVNLTKVFDVSYNEYGYPTAITDKATERKYIIEYKIVVE